MTKRNNNIDILRTFSIILIIVYHIYAIFNIKTTKIIDCFISLGGEVGVTAFFVLSGISIYFSLNRDHSSFKKYIKKRMIRILPQYYINILIVLFLISGGTYLAVNHLGDIVTHIFLIHTLFYSYHGSINGVLWTIGVIWWFYILAFFIFKAFCKYPKTFLFGSIALTIISKIIIFNIIADKNLDSIYYFIYGRQLITTIDNFIVGMFLGKLITENKENKYNNLNIMFSSLLLIGWILIASNPINNALNINMYLHDNNILNYIYHTVLALLIGYFFLYFTKIKFNTQSIINKIIIFIAKHQYGLYIWHLLIILSIKDSPIIAHINTNYSILLYPILFIIIVPICLLLDTIIDSYDYEKILKK